MQVLMVDDKRDMRDLRTAGVAPAVVTAGSGSQR